MGNSIRWETKCGFTNPYVHVILNRPDADPVTNPYVHVILNRPDADPVDLGTDSFIIRFLFNPNLILSGRTI
jgi:hypothetical protein